MPGASRDEDLVSRCLAGDARAERLFYDTFFPVVLGVTSRYALDQQQAVDYLNRTFVTAFKNLQQFRGDGSLRGWLKAIAVNECLSQLRIKRNHAYAELPVDNTAAIDPAALQTLGVEDLLVLVRRLPEVPRTVFNLVGVEGFSHAEVAKKLNITETNSRYHLRQARLQLQAAVTKLKLT
ncbi:RNA polymerase sigma factor [Lewinella sp. 4G2]|uniref:RNA polymerase sigma factor n=1 Tax=Lewinella sp. 4G2 TaxID=1803372 RepID=UPI0007B49483|nr:RNA polymerase sigma factor [Lewinella sp. 4G2]OAV45520.1 hypothetical protein A3850_013925 [Lewinella sp. 4G2]